MSQYQTLKKGNTYVTRIAADAVALYELGYEPVTEEACVALMSTDYLHPYRSQYIMVPIGTDPRIVKADYFRNATEEEYQRYAKEGNPQLPEGAKLVYLSDELEEDAEIAEEPRSTVRRAAIRPKVDE